MSHSVYLVFLGNYIKRLFERQDCYEEISELPLKGRLDDEFGFF
jgi:hypothetical protein